jgi:hypothetical protein
MTEGQFAVVQYIRSLSVERTERGVLFLMIGILASGVPVIQPVGSLISLTGVIWYVLGSGPFGKKQSNFAVLAAGIFVVGLGFVLVGSIAFFVFILSLSNTSLPLWWWGNSALATALIPSLTLILEIETAGAIAVALAYLLLIYYVQRPVGRAMLLVALVVNIALSLLVLSILSSSIPYNILTVLGGYNPEPAHNFANKVLVVGLLNLIPAVIYATAYYDLFSRIREGQLPPSI